MYQVDQEKCIGCGKCVEACTFGAIRLQGEGKEKKAFIDPTMCQDCGACAQVCPVGAIARVPFKEAMATARAWEGMGAWGNFTFPWQRGACRGPGPGGGRGMGRGRGRGRGMGPGRGMGRGRRRGGRW